MRVNIEIMRVFVRLKKLELGNELIREKLRELESKVERHDSQIQSIFEAIHQILAPPEKPKLKIGFHP